MNVAEYTSRDNRSIYAANKIKLQASFEIASIDEGLCPISKPTKTINAFCWNIGLTDVRSSSMYNFECVAAKHKINVECEQEINYTVYVRLLNVLSKIYHYHQLLESQFDISTDAILKTVDIMPIVSGDSAFLTAAEKLIANTYKLIDDDNDDTTHTTDVGEMFNKSLLYDMLDK